MVEKNLNYNHWELGIGTYIVYVELVPEQFL